MLIVLVGIGGATTSARRTGSEIYLRQVLFAGQCRGATSGDFQENVNSAEWCWVPYLRLFGGVSIKVEGQSLAGEAGQARRMAVLAMLAIAGDKAITRERLIGCLWPDVSESQARHLLSEALYQLRKSLGSDAILADGTGLRLNRQIVSSDIAEFEAAMAHGELEAATSLYAGPFLDGFTVRDAPDFEQWAETERHRLGDAFAAVLERLAVQAADARSFVAATSSWKRLGAHDPYNSRYVVGLMRSLAAAGDPANAIQCAEEHARLLRDDLHADPPESLVQLVDQLRREPGSLEAAAHAAELDRSDTAPGGASKTAQESSRATGQDDRDGSSERRRLSRGIAGVALVLTAVVLVWATLEWRAASMVPGPAANDPDSRIAVLPFTYNGDDESAYLGQSIHSLLSTRLDGVRGTRTVDPLAVEGIVEQLGDPGTNGSVAHVVAESVDVSRYVTGRVTEHNGELHIEARISSAAAGSGAASTASVYGDVASFFDLVDDLSRQLLLSITGAVEEQDVLAASTTGSLQALKEYLAGVAHRDAWDFSEAFAAFRRAVEIDSSFAIAWHAMAVSAAWVPMMEWDAGIEASRQAVHHSVSLPQRTQAVIRAYSAMMLGDAPEAERLTGEVLVDYPNDVQAWYILAWASALNPFFGRSVGEGREALERAYRFDPHDPDHRAGAAWWAAVEGNWARLDSVWDNRPVSDNRPAARIVRAFGSGDSLAREQILAAAGPEEAEDLLLASAWLAWTRDDIRAALRLARRVDFGSNPHNRELVNLHIHTASLELALGRWRAAQVELAQAAALNPVRADLYRALWISGPLAQTISDDARGLWDAIDRWDTGAIQPSVTHTGDRAYDLLAPQLRHYVLGRLAVHGGDHETALRHAEWIEEADNVPEAFSFAADRAQGLRALVYFDRGRHAEALEALEAQPRRIRIQWLYVAPFYGSPEDRFLRGEIHEQLGNDEDALRWYATINEVTSYDAPYLAVAHLRRGAIHERLGDAETAALHYRKFIALWEGCDPEFRPLVEDAREALERLRSQPPE